MDKTYNPHKVEDTIYRMWEKGGYFTPKIQKDKKPFTIILPLPNANDPMHMGHALFTVEDIMIRRHRMKGEPTLWLPGGDHAGIETQFVFEKKLAKDKKSRFDFDRNTLYKMISDFVDENKNINRDQMKRLGFSMDWSRYHFSLEPDIVERVLETFRKLHRDNLIYRAERLVNYCTKCGTAFSDLEVVHEEKDDLLYFIDYGTIQIATARPETIFADVAAAVNPKDKKYGSLIGKTAVIPLINRKIPIISDHEIDIEFGTGALKVTPAHDQTDYEIGGKHKLPIINTIDRFGRMMNVPDKYLGMKVKAARNAVVADLQKKGLLTKTEKLVHQVAVCYRCKTTIEPMLMPQWFIKTKPLAKPAIAAVKKGQTKIVPLKRFEKLYFDWLKNIKDWNISRQIVWGPRIPVWYCLDCNPDIEISFINTKGQNITGKYLDLIADYSFHEIKNGLQTLTAPVASSYGLEDKPCPECGGKNILQETDTFDTWFLSGQWPVNTLKAKAADFEYFYPTSVLDTLWDILFFWVARMMMFGLYLTGKVPFRTVHIHSRVVDRHGQKMSKSKGNVLNPIEMVEKYGADALRMALIFGAAPGSDISISEDKIRGMRNFANKLWNVGRFLYLSFQSPAVKNQTVPWYDKSSDNKLTKGDKDIVNGLNLLIKEVNNNLKKYRFSDAAQEIYDFTWHTLADKYLEENKSRFAQGDLIALSVLRHILMNTLKLLHPIMPFVTEEIYRQIPGWNGIPLIISSWPE